MGQAGFDVNQPTPWQQNMSNAGFTNTTKSPISPDCVTVLKIIDKLSPKLKQAIQGVLAQHGCPTQTINGEETAQTQKWTGQLNQPQPQHKPVVAGRSQWPTSQPAGVFQPN